MSGAGEGGIDPYSATPEQIKGLQHEIEALRAKMAAEHAEMTELVKAAASYNQMADKFISSPRIMEALKGGGRPMSARSAAPPSKLRLGSGSPMMRPLSAAAPQRPSTSADAAIGEGMQPIQGVGSTRMPSLSLVSSTPVVRLAGVLEVGGSDEAPS